MPAAHTVHMRSSLSALNNNLHSFVKLTRTPATSQEEWPLLLHWDSKAIFPKAR